MRRKILYVIGAVMIVSAVFAASLGQSALTAFAVAMAGYFVGRYALDVKP